MQDLGAALGSHRLRLHAKLAGVLVGAAITVVLVWAVADIKPKSQVLAWGVVGFAATATLCLLIGFLLDRSQLITRYERGIAWKRSGRERRILLADIAQADEWSTRGKPVVLVLRLHSGKEHRIPSNVVEHDALVAHVCGLRVARVIPTAVVVGGSGTKPEVEERAPFRLEDIG
jgi:hypothetical protein